MAAADQNAVSQYPEPPHFYELYRDGPAAGPPPPAPLEEEFTVFGAPFNLREPLVPPLEVGSLITQREDGTIDAKGGLLKLNQALLVLFLELLSVLVEQPSAYAEMLTRVIGALQNMQHLVNTLRPEQARHTLEFILQQQITRKQEALQRLRTEVDGLRQQLGGITAQLAAAGGDAAESAPQRPCGGAAAAMDTT